MKKKICALAVCLILSAGSTQAQVLSSGTTNDKVFVTGEANTGQPWGEWFTQVYMPYYDELGIAILGIAQAAGQIDLTGKSSETIRKEVGAALNNSLMKMAKIKPPIELKAYHLKVVELYRQTINADPEDGGESKIAIKQTTREANQALRKVFEMHGVPEGVISNHSIKK